MRFRIPVSTPSRRPRISTGRCTRAVIQPSVASRSARTSSKRSRRFWDMAVVERYPVSGVVNGRGTTDQNGVGHQLLQPGRGNEDSLHPPGFHGDSDCQSPLHRGQARRAEFAADVGKTRSRVTRTGPVSWLPDRPNELRRPELQSSVPPSTGRRIPRVSPSRRRGPPPRPSDDCAPREVVETLPVSSRIGLPRATSAGSAARRRCTGGRRRGRGRGPGSARGRSR